ncbi:MAG: cell division protein FtsL [Acidiferrobacterales bacterium]
MNSKLGLLAILVLISAVAVVELRHRNRTTFTHLQSLMQIRDDLGVEWSKLLLEEGAWSQHRRIESTAVRKLGMQIPDNVQVVIVDLRGSGGQR